MALAGQVNITIIPNPGYSRIVPDERLVEAFSGRRALAFDGTTLLVGVNTPDASLRHIYAFSRDAVSVRALAWVPRGVTR